MSFYDKYTTELMNKIYGSKMCSHCEKEQPVIVHILQGSENWETIGNEVVFKFTGSYSCSVCYKAIGNKDKP